ncbi:hypothetical protein [Scytonema hofmannii]|uniref:hypothetical protein n=1 Tax=Scytonema hofmannii TaxID=34078 RepID=UPI0003460197|nr:hypothetical protein [Scytonema hofmannii]
MNEVLQLTEALQKADTPVEPKLSATRVKKVVNRLEGVEAVEYTHPTPWLLVIC